MANDSQPPSHEWSAGEASDKSHPDFAWLVPVFRDRECVGTATFFDGPTADAFARMVNRGSDPEPERKVLLAAEWTRMMKARDDLRTELVRSMREHTVSGDGLPLVLRDMERRASAIAARTNGFHIDREGLSALDRASTGSDYVDKFPLRIAQHIWGVR